MLGLKHSSATFYRAMDNSLADVSNVKRSLGLVDFHSKNMEEDVESSEEDMVLIHNHVFRAKLKKIRYAAKSAVAGSTHS